MNIVKYTEARKKLRSVLDDVVNTEIPTCIVSKDSQVVVITKDQYDRVSKAIDGTEL